MLVKIFPFLLFISLMVFPVTVTHAQGENLESSQALQQVCADDRSKGSSYCADVKNKNNPIVGTDGLINKIANLVATVAGIVAVIVIIIGGMMMVLSGGDSQKFANGRNTVIYALVGVVLIAVARAIVALVTVLAIK